MESGNAQQLGNNDPFPHQSAAPTASPKGEAINARVRELREQIAQDEAYLTAKERDMQNVADVARARLENERQMKELETPEQPVTDRELRDLEQTAQTREDAAELAAKKAAEEADAAELEGIAKQRQYGFTMTSYFIEGYFDANKRVQMDIPTYDEAVRVAYGQGRYGHSFKKVDSQNGISDDVLREAYQEGRQKGEENGTAGTQDSGKRDAGMDSREPAGSVGSSARASAEESAGGFGVKESRSIQSRLSTAKAERLSAKADGIENGTETKAFYRVPDAMVQEYAELRQAKKILTDAGADDVRFVSGTLEIKTGSGKPLRVEGIAQDGTVWINIDAKNGVLKVAEHESMHLRMENEPGLRDRLLDSLGLSQEQMDKLALKYCEAYEGCYGREDLTLYLDEIVCDAYAGINRMGLGADKFQDRVRTTADTQTSQSAKKPAQTRGPPVAKHSIVTLPDGKKFVRADRQVIFGNDPKAWSVQLEDYINGKIRRGQDVQLVGADGDVLLLTATSAGKLSDNHTSNGRTMSDTAYERKVNAAAHIDELAQVSTRGQSVVKDYDGRHGTMATEGWNYRKAYFQDFDGKYYNVTISIPQSENGRMIYNIGNMKEEASPKVKGSSAETGNAPRGFASSDTSVRGEGKNVNRKFSIEAEENGTYGTVIKLKDGSCVQIADHGDISELSFKPFGIRTLPAETKKKYTVGSKLPNSYNWDREDDQSTFYTDKSRLPGASAIGLESLWGEVNSVEEIADGVRDAYNGRYSAFYKAILAYGEDGDKHRIIVGDGYEYGEDPGEVIIHNPRVWGIVYRYGNESEVKSLSELKDNGYGRFSPDTQERAPELTDEAKVYDYDKLPGKARRYVDAAVNRATRQAANAMSVPGKAQREVLKPAIRGMMDEFLQTGKIAQETIDESFENAYDAGVEENREFYDEFKFVLDRLSRGGVKVPQEVRADFADFKQFQKVVRGRILLNNEGLPIDTLYGELNEQAPGLFPQTIMNPADQLQRMADVVDKIRITKQTLDEAHKGDGGDFKRWARNDFEAAVEDMKASLRTARAWAQSRDGAIFCLWRMVRVEKRGEFGIIAVTIEVCAPSVRPMTGLCGCFLWADGGFLCEGYRL